RRLLPVVASCRGGSQSYQYYHGAPVLRPITFHPGDLMNTLRLLAVGAIACLIGAGARAEEKIDHAKLIVGKWEVSKADEGTVPPGSIIEFTKDGKLKLSGKKDAADVAFEGT